MRIGLIGPSEEDPALLREAAEFLLGDAGVEHAVYLGTRATLSKVVDAWGEQVTRGFASEERFLEHAAALALSDGEGQALSALLERDRERKRLDSLSCLPAPPGRTVELFDDKLVLLVHDKASLDQEDIANAFVVVYGKSKQAAVHRFGPRTFCTPGPLKAGRVMVLEREPEGHLAIGQFDPHTGEPRGRDVIQVRRARLVVNP
ncbi:MAG: hypothetical protein ABW352_00355 [Polyangiales bacterium]